MGKFNTLRMQTVITVLDPSPCMHDLILRHKTWDKKELMLRIAWQNLKRPDFHTACHQDLALCNRTIVILGTNGLHANYAMYMPWYIYIVCLACKKIVPTGTLVVWHTVCLLLVMAHSDLHVLITEHDHADMGTEHLHETCGILVTKGEGAPCVTCCTVDVKLAPAIGCLFH